MSRQTIAVDVDDVLAASAGDFVGFSNRRWGTRLTIKDYDERWAKMWRVDHTEELKRAKVIHETGVFRRFGNLERSNQVLTKLAQKYKLVITTSRSAQAGRDTEDWLERHYSGIFEEIHLSGFFDTVKPDSHERTKTDLCRSIGADYLIDDHPKHCLAAAGAGIMALLFGDYPWNRNVKLPDNMIRVKNWRQVAEYFDSGR